MQNPKREAAPAAKQAPKAARKPYANPKLAEHGDVRSLTQHNVGNSCLTPGSKSST